MLGEILYEETGRTTGMRVLAPEGSDVIVEVSLQTQGLISGVSEMCFWTNHCKVRADGTMYGEGNGYMAIQGGDIIRLVSQGSCKAAEPDGTVRYRGAVYFHTNSEKWKHLNGGVGVHHYDIDPAGNSVHKIWEWK
jgi:hypothetical protein